MRIFGDHPDYTSSSQNKANTSDVYNRVFEIKILRL